MDSAEELPEFENFNAIRVVTGHFAKMHFYIPAKEILDKQERSECILMRSLESFGLYLTTVHHPQTDGLSERVIQMLKQFLRMDCHDRQHRWVRWLPLVQFAYKSTTHTTHAIRVNNEEVGSRFGTIKTSTQHFLLSMTSTHPSMTSTHPSLRVSRRQGRAFETGDMVLVGRRNATIKASNDRSLSNIVTDKTRPHAYKLEIPARMRLRHTIHVMLLKAHQARGNSQG